FSLEKTMSSLPSPSRSMNRQLEKSEDNNAACGRANASACQRLANFDHFKTTLVRSCASISSHCPSLSRSRIKKRECHPILSPTALGSNCDKEGDFAHAFPSKCT